MGRVIKKKKIGFVPDIFIKKREYGMSKSPYILLKNKKVLVIIILFLDKFPSPVFLKQKGISKQLYNGVIALLNDTRMSGFELPVPILPVLAVNIL